MKSDIDQTWALAFLAGAQRYCSAYRNGSCHSWEDAKAGCEAMNEASLRIIEQGRKSRTDDGGGVKLLIMVRVGDLETPWSQKLATNLIRFVNAFESGERDKARYESLCAIQQLDQAMEHISRTSFQNPTRKLAVRVQMIDAGKEDLKGAGNSLH